MDINIKHLSDKEIANICIKYNIINSGDLKNYTRDNVINEINKWCKYKKESYKRRNSSPNLSQNIKKADTDVTESFSFNLGTTF